MKTITKTTTYATFNELSNEQQEQVLEKYSDYLVHDDWYRCTQEQINMILEDLFGGESDKIYFDTDRNSFCSFAISVYYKDLFELLESNKIQENYPDLAKYLSSEIQSIKDCYFFKKKRMFFEIVFDYLYSAYVKTGHGRNSLKIDCDFVIYHANIPNIENELANLSDCIEQFFNSLSNYFENLFRDELTHLYSDTALIEYFGDYDTHFDIETLEME